MITHTMLPATANNDAELVGASLAGDRDAFGRIISRYQSLVCSLAYSATGSLTTSEDLAQETFVTAWKQLDGLREPEKLRAWLCGIARNLINNFLRRQGREPSHRAESLEEISESPSPGLMPPEHAISNEEMAILWRSLERVPEIYREPLVLFYREHQSIERVARNLDLTEDAVKQRLSRGRKLLHEQVLAFVESALAKTNPGQAFTIGVLAVLPVLSTTSAKAAVLGAAAAKGSFAAKAAVAGGWFSSIMGPLMCFVGPWVQYRMSLDAATTRRERELVKRMFRKISLSFLLFGLVFFALCWSEPKIMPVHPVLFLAALNGLVLVFIALLASMGMQSSKLFRKMHAVRPAGEANSPAKRVWEYRSRFELLGLPLVHVRLNDATPGVNSPVKAWIAAGNIAFGVLFAFGGVAVAPVSIGGVAIGLLAWGGMALGGFAAGGLALGGWAFGGFALGWRAFGGCAIGLNAALGGLAMARDYALGGSAYAAQANNETASQFIKGNSFFRNMMVVSHHVVWLNLVWLIPLLTWWRKLAKAAKKS